MIKEPSRPAQSSLSLTSPSGTTFTDPASIPEPRPWPSLTKEFVVPGSEQDIQIVVHVDRVTLSAKHYGESAEMICTYYEAVGTTKDRPLTIAFNGGPGASSAYLHFGALGPFRSDFNAGSTSESFGKNDEHWLGFTDLLFIDPIETGFSRVDERELKKSEEKRDHSYFKTQGDLNSIAECIERWITKFKRWGSPITLCGESYGGFRAPKLARMLQEQHGVGVANILLISPALDLSSVVGTDYDILPWIFLLPSFAATAVEHQVISSDLSLRQLLTSVEQFAVSDYASLLLQGDALELPTREQIVETLASYTGISKDAWSRSSGRISRDLVVREILRDRQLVCAVHDASMTLHDPFPDRLVHEGPDPVMSALYPCFTTTANRFYHEFLGLSAERPYRVFNREIFEVWEDDSQRSLLHPCAHATDDLRYCLTSQPTLKVFICHGYYDLVTPYFSSLYLLRHFKLPPSESERTKFVTYEGGHMFYIRDKARRSFCADVREIITG